jgi:hypothetical protein
MVARAACAFVTPVLLLLLYILGRPVRIHHGVALLCWSRRR